MAEPIKGSCPRSWAGLTPHSSAGLWPLLVAPNWPRRSSSSSRRGEPRLGWEIPLPRHVCASTGFAPGVTPGETLQLLGQFSFNCTCPAAVAGAALGFEGVPGAGSQIWLVLPGQCVLQGQTKEHCSGCTGENFSPVPSHCHVCRKSGESTAWPRETSG